MTKTGNYNWTPRYEVGAIYKSKLNNNRYYIESSGSKTCALSVRILEKNVVLDLEPNAFDRRKENKNIFYGFMQKDLDKANSEIKKLEEQIKTLKGKPSKILTQ